MPGKRICQTKKPYTLELRARDRLLASIHKISRLLTRPVSLDKILTAIVKETSVAFGLKRVGIYLTNKDKTLLECKYIIGFSPQDAERALTRPFRLNEQDCIETRVVKFGKTIFIKDFQTDPSLTPVDLKSRTVMKRISGLAVPMKIKRDVIGLIVADRDQVKFTLTRKDLDSISTFANQASVIIENARLLEQNQKKIRQLMTLQEVSTNTNSLFDLEELLNPALQEQGGEKMRQHLVRETDGNPNSLFHFGELLNTICTSAVRISHASSGILFLLDQDGEFLRVAAHSGFGGNSAVEEFTLRVGDGAAGRAVSSASPMLVKNLVKNLYQGWEKPLPIKGKRSALAVPLMSKKQVLGILDVFSPSESAFSEDDLKTLTIFAGYAESLLRNVRLYERVIAERNLKENILESSSNGIVAVNLQKEITSVNRRAEEIFQISRADVGMLPAAEVFEKDISMTFDIALYQNCVMDRKEFRREGRDGKTKILEISSSPLRNHRGDLIGAMMSVQDLTDTRKAEETMFRMEKLSSLGQLSTGIAHEIRNPLSSIYFNVQMLSKRLPLDDTTRGIIADTFEGIDRIKGLVKSVLDFARPSTPSLKIDSILRVLRRSISIMDLEPKKKKIQIQLDLACDLPNIIIDSHQIQQVFINLLLNAMEAISEEGTIVIRGKVESDPKLLSDRLIIEIKDTGIGISSEYLPRIFDPFFTTKPEGTGLGLSIVHRILIQHDATIDVFSDCNGTVFTLSFPIPTFGAK
jgi:two-component system NtrC family sensor kinase